MRPDCRSAAEIPNDYAADSRRKRVAPMALRSPHGKAAQHSPAPRVEVPPVDELGKGVPAPMPAVAGPERDASGRFLPGAKSSATKGGRAKRGRLAIATRLGLEKFDADPAFAPYLHEAEAFARAERKRLRETVAGGETSAAVDSTVLSAAWQLAASKYLMALGFETGDPKVLAQASRLANDHRQNLLAAHHLAELAAKSAPKGPPPILVMAPRSAEDAPTRPAAPPPVLGPADDDDEPEDAAS